jgi:hypothetical protein
MKAGIMVADMAVTSTVADTSAEAGTSTAATVTGSLVQAVSGLSVFR